MLVKCKDILGSAGSIQFFHLSCTHNVQKYPTPCSILSDSKMRRRWSPAIMLWTLQKNVKTFVIISFYCKIFSKTQVVIASYNFSYHFMTHLPYFLGNYLVPNSSREILWRFCDNLFISGKVLKKRKSSLNV